MSSPTTCGVEAPWRAARDLARRLASGCGLPVLDGRPGHGEVLHVRAGASAWEFRPAASVVERPVVMVGPPDLVAAGILAAAVDRRRARAEAAAAAVPRWWSLGPGPVTVTDRRLVVGDVVTGTSVWCDRIRSVTVDAGAGRVDVVTDERAPVRVTGPWAAYLGVALVFVVEGRVVRLPEAPSVVGPPPPPAPVARRGRRLRSLVG